MFRTACDKVGPVSDTALHAGRAYVELDPASLTCTSDSSRLVCSRDLCNGGGRSGGAVGAVADLLLGADLFDERERITDVGRWDKPA